MKAIIPCAGYGTRVGMRPDQSKEMLPDANHKGKPLIQWCLDICKAFNIEPLVITRKEKKDLRQYLFNAGVKFIDIKVEREWADSILKSKDHWDEQNILILPDTRFDRIRCIEDIQRGLSLGNKAVLALHEVTDPDKWGIVKDYMMYEKPDLTGKQWAWGLIGFTKFEGECIFTGMRDEGYFYLEHTGFTFLNKFEDLTRGDKK